MTMNINNNNNNNYNASTSPRLTQEELQRSVERLTRRAAEPKQDIKPPCQTHVISQAELERHIKHLYEDSITHKEMEYARIAQAEDAALRKDATLTTHILSSDEVESMVHRLYDEAVAHKTQTLHELSMQMLAKSAVNSTSSKTRKLSRAEEQEAVDRYYKGGMSRERAKQVALFKKYVLDRLPKSRAHELNSSNNKTECDNANANEYTNVSYVNKVST